ncbi:MAG TPA: PhaM family polyhydroxyalkanoate granule multifunctional regulatory protein [Burkholderiales bacterium]|nr:PhaM family polyhydroxyalkanoate granule multifunctional regulatory protein [Burkholderiales bacterium]
MAEDFSSKDWFEHFQKMWNPMNFPLPGMFQPTMDIGEIDRKIAELKAVESWLRMNLGFLDMTIKALEMQKAALQALHEAAKNPEGGKPKGEGGSS